MMTARINVKLKPENAYCFFTGSKEGNRKEYAYTKAYRDWTLKTNNQAHEINFNEVDDEKIKKMFNRLIRNRNSIYDTDIKCLYHETTKKINAIYFF